MVNRMERIDELLRQELSRLLEQDVERLGMLTVVAVQTARDLSVANVLITPIGNQAPVDLMEELEARARNYRHELGKRLDLRRIPAFSFKLDQEAANYNRIEELFDQIENRS